jgi:hypothetical protein
MSEGGASSSRREWVWVGMVCGFASHVRIPHATDGGETRRSTRICGEDLRHTMLWVWKWAYAFECDFPLEKLVKRRP